MALSSPSFHPSLLPLAQSSDSLRRVGASGAHLVHLFRRGCPLQTTWLLDVAACRDFLQAHVPPGHDLPTLLRLSRSRLRLERAARARDQLLAVRFDPALRHALVALGTTLGATAPQGLMVRCSPTTDDESIASLANLDAVWPRLQDPVELVRVVREGWAMLYLPEALLCLAQRGIRDVSMAFVIQPFVEPQGLATWSFPPRELLSKGGPTTAELLTSASVASADEKRLPALAQQLAAKAAEDLGSGGWMITTTLGRKPRASSKRVP